MNSSEKSRLLSSLSRVLLSIGLAVIIAFLIEWQFTRHPYHGLLFARDFGVRVLGCAIGLTVSRFVWERHHRVLITGVVLTFLLIDAPGIHSYFPFDPIDFYPFKFLPLMWAKIAWFAASVGVTVVGSIIGEQIGKRLRGRFFVDSLTRPDSAV